MDKLPIDLGALPEPLKSMAQNLDPQMIEKFVTMYDPATLSLMMNSMLSMLKDSLPADQTDTLKEMMENILKLMPRK
ncbi:MAG: hypothetical protein VR68_15830 [Peptococcaceae bacterium BRH_c4a]|nr:MAG: hypothetical protein VR68_15830 [Peptococcaceae bacterium BRH_c4a]